MGEGTLRSLKVLSDNSQRRKGEVRAKQVSRVTEAPASCDWVHSVAGSTAFLDWEGELSTSSWIAVGHDGTRTRVVKVPWATTVKVSPG